MKLSPAKPPALALAFMLSTSVGAIAADTLQWTKLPPIPDREGFAWPFAGVSGGGLIVAGGANFPDKKPWEGGTKVWYDKVFVLEKPEGQWREAGKLKRRLGYGISVDMPNGTACIGGSDAAKHYAEGFLLDYDPAKGKVRSRPFAKLPQPVANASGALLDETIYIAGGIATPTATKALDTFFSFDLRSKRKKWLSMETWPGRERMLAIAGAYDGAFYLFGGCALKAGTDGKPEREWLRDAYRFRPGEGWKRIADLPRVAVAAPSPAPVVNGKLLILGGDDGAQVNTPPTEHKGFPRSVLAYGPAKDKWETLGEVPFSLVTTPAVEWQGRVIIPGGEARPGIRSTEVWSARTPPDPL
jgi:N-acetylneuraminic acid mutarotase